MINNNRARRLILIFIIWLSLSIANIRSRNTTKESAAPRSHLLKMAKQTTNLLKQLRRLMQDVKYVKEPIQAYIIPSNDAHNSEYLAECDKYRAYVSGFTGSAGTALVTQDEAFLWTDGRYFLQASQQLDSNWKLMKEGLPQTPTQGVWLSKNLPRGSRIGVDPNLYSHQDWMLLQIHLEQSGQKLIPIATNLIETIWADRPERPVNAVKPLALKFTGMQVSGKLDIVRKTMEEKRASILVLTSLDEVAWFLNLRGSDIEYNPLFFAYVVVLPTKLILFIRNEQVTEEVRTHLNNQIGDSNYIIEPYNSIGCKLTELIQNLNNGLVWFSEHASYALTNLVSKSSLLTETTPVASMKVVKNSVEIAGMRNAHIKDAAALCCYFAWLEENVGSGIVTEVSGAQKLQSYRAMQADYMGDSFSTISSVGPHGAIIHYEPDEHSDVPITVDALYLCDSGGHYRDGTTDVTRTMHFGTPTEYEKECFTRVLKGQIKLATAVFPTKIKGNCLDSFAREFLWAVGLDYAHGTGHGIGHYLNVHEVLMGISWRPMPEDPGLEANMFLSNEPGYYEDGKFGIRIEDIVQIVEAKPPHNFANRGFLTFDTITLVPKQIKLINVDMLTDQEIEYLNKYHKQCREVVGELLEQQGQAKAKEWLVRETQTITKK